MIRRLLLTFTGAVVLALPAEAAETPRMVAVRSGDHDGYVRIVFDLSEQAGYDVRQNGKVLEVSFDKALAADTKGVQSGAGEKLTSFTQTSPPGQPLKMQIGLPEGSTFRQFMAGNRVVVDVMTGDRKQGTQKPEAKPELERKLQETLSKKQAENQKMPAVTAAPVKAEPVFSHGEGHKKTLLEAAAPAIDAHVITLATTQTVGMAAFERAGYLWMVFDRPDIKVPPELAGPNPELFGAFTRTELKGGVAYRLKLPAEGNIHAYGEGGGLVWRVVLSSRTRDLKPVPMERSYAMAQQKSRGGSVSWAMPGVTRVIDLPDPSVGDVLKVLTVESSDKYAGPGVRLVDFKTIDSPVGLTIQPLADDLKIDVTQVGVTVSRPNGLAFSPQSDVNRHDIRKDVRDASLADAPAEPGDEIRRIYDFDRWMLGGIQALRSNQNILLSAMANKDQSGRVQDLLTLAKMNIANDRAQEAIGFLRYAADDMPAIVESPEYMALRAAAHDLAGKYELAVADLQSAALKDYNELDYWRAYTFAGLEDWQQAAHAMPKDFSVLTGYPKPLLEKIGLKLAEVALRNGEADTAKSVLAVLNRERNTLKSSTQAGIDYLEGEANRQKSDFEKARALWEPLVKGADDFYRARAGLALTMLEVQTGAHSSDQAIDRLEGLRYAWRGDELEAQINFTLGKMYLEKDRYMKAFTIMRDAASMSPEADISKDIADYMADSFKNLMLNDQNLNPLDAVAIYEGFRELTPTGDEGNAIVQKLAERLVEADLLSRAASVLQHQVDFRLQGEEKARIALRLGVIYLLDKNPAAAIKSFDLARNLYEGILKDSVLTAKTKEIDLLRARALSQMNRAEEAIALLNKFDPSPDVNKLRADISWRAGLWDDAAEALQDLILDEALDPGRPMTPYQADLVLNRAVALNLSGNRVALANLRKRFEEGMKKTSRAHLFDVITRPRPVGMTMLSTDKETLDSIVAEVDMFKGFLDAYKTVVQTGSKLTPEKPSN